MKIEDIRKKLSSMGLKKKVGVNTKNMKKTELVQFIQTTEGNSPCFRSAESNNCSQTNCLWFKDCQK